MDVVCRGLLRSHRRERGGICDLSRALRASGGKYLAGGFNKAISLFGSPPPNRVVLLQFADMDAVKAFYVKQKQIEADVGNKYASFRVIGIEGVEQK